MLVNETELKNGMRLVHQQVGYSKLSHIGIFINVGSRDEDENERGVAHFLEHVLFKGTNKRKSFHILNARKFFGRFIETKVNVLLGCNFSIDIFMSRVGIKPIADSAYEDHKAITLPVE